MKRQKKMIRCVNQEGKSPLTVANEYGSIKCIDILTKNDAKALDQNRNAMLLKLAEKLVNAPPDYQKSCFK
jgi:hypothetical protein